jgi:hypothetical protein
MGIRRHLLFFLLFCTALAAEARESDIAAVANMKNTYAFIENKGQITDQYHQPRKDIDFKIDLPGVTMFIGSGHISYQWYKADKNSPLKDNTPTTCYRLDMTLQGVQQHIVPQKEEPQSYYEQYYTGNLGSETIAGGYKKIIYRNIYPGIDWVIYSTGQQLKYDFVVHEGGNPAVIKMQYAGYSDIQTVKNGLQVTTPLGSIFENPPYTYEKQSHKTVSSYFRVMDNTVEVITGKYTGDLVIDPVVDFATYYGDSGNDIGNAIAADNRGNTYLAGTTNSVNNIATTGAHQLLLQGQYDGFLVSFDHQGNRRWATYFGGVDFEDCYDAVCDPAGNIYVCGKTSSTSAIASVGAQQPLYGGGANDGFLIKFGKDGTREWGTYFGGAASDAVNNVTCDALGNIFICGSTSSSNNISFNNPHQPNLAGLTDGFVARFTPLGQRQWSTYYGGAGIDAVNFDACDLFGNLYIFGNTESTSGIATPGAHQIGINTASSTTFLTKFNVAGSVQWGTYFGGTSGASPGGIVCDGIGDVYICGYTSSTTGIAAGTGAQLVKGAGQDGFISRFSSSGGQTWGSYFGNSGKDNFTGITITPKNRLFLSGITTGNAGMTTPDALQLTLNGNNDAHVSEWTVNGNLVYASYLGGNSDESLPAGNYGSFIEYNFGKIYLCGTTNSTTNISTPNGFRKTFSGGITDAFMASQIVDTISYILAGQFADTILCEGQQFNLPYNVTLPFDPPNNFMAQLSDPSGSFIGATNIGVVINNAGGVISCTIPLGTTTGTAYRIRLVSSSPIYTSIDNGINIKIDNIPTTPAITNGSPGCIGDTLKMGVTNPQPGVTYFWDGPGFTGNAVSISFNKAIPIIVGVYNITPIVGGCIGTNATTTVTLKPTPSITNKGNNSPICEGETLFLTSNSDMPGSTFEWKGPSFTSVQQNPSLTNVTSAASGIYTVAATFNGCTSKKDSLNVLIKHKPLLIKNSNSPVCETDTLKFGVADADAQTQYTWTGPGGFNTTTPVNAISNMPLSGSGLYIVNATNNGCVTLDTIAVTVKPMPYPSASNNSPICSGENLELNVSSLHSGTKFNWYGPDDFNKTEQNPVIEHARYIATGLYRIIANLDGCVQEDTTTVKVTQAPTTVITTNSPVYSTQQLQVFASNNLNNAIYSWTGPSNFRTSTQNITIDNVTTANAGFYILKTEYENCSAIDSIEVEVLEFLGYQIFVLYPSPNNGEFTLRGIVRKDIEIPITIHDIAGREIYKDKLKTLNKQLNSKIELGGRLASGVYILSIRAEGDIIQKRFTVIR